MSEPVAGGTPPQAETHTHGSSAPVVDTMAARRAAQVAFLPLVLRPGMQILNVGCGPVGVAGGLAEVLAPGEVLGLDAGPSVVERGATSALRGRERVRRALPGRVVRRP